MGEKKILAFIVTCSFIFFILNHIFPGDSKTGITIYQSLIYKNDKVETSKTVTNNDKTQESTHTNKTKTTSTTKTTTTTTPTTTTTTTKTAFISAKEKSFKSNASSQCRLPQDLGPLWRRSGFANLKFWKNYIKNVVNDTNLPNDTKLFSTVNGAWKPKNCTPTDSIAFIVPFRNREDNLKVFLHIIHPLLQRQQLDYQIFVIEQGGEKDKAFNKGKLFNIGFLTARLMRPDLQCFVFHDVDLVPEDERILYRCDKTGLVHLGAMVDTLKYKPMQIQMVGGVMAVTKEQYFAVNGFSNLYWGWGGEDDDFGFRIMESGYQIKRKSIKNSIYHFTMLRHESRHKAANKKRFSLLRKAKERFHRDGLNSLLQLKFASDGVEEKEDYVKVVVDVKTET